MKVAVFLGCDALLSDVYVSTFTVEINQTVFRLCLSIGFIVTCFIML